ncbi:hypothetical protein BKA93DRAFT_750927 [Sparassis latifolia]
MEFIKGSSGKAVDLNKVSEAQLRTIASAMSSGLHKMIQCDVYHPDIDPRNMIIRQGDLTSDAYPVVLIDFAFSKLFPHSPAYVRYPVVGLQADTADTDPRSASFQVVEVPNHCDKVSTGSPMAIFRHSMALSPSTRCICSNKEFAAAIFTPTSVQDAHITKAGLPSVEAQRWENMSHCRSPPGSGVSMTSSSRTYELLRHMFDAMCMEKRNCTLNQAEWKGYFSEGRKYYNELKRDLPNELLLLLETVEMKAKAQQSVARIPTSWCTWLSGGTDTSSFTPGLQLQTNGHIAAELTIEHHNGGLPAYSQYGRTS